MKHLPVRCTKCKKRHSLREDFKDFEFSPKGPKCQSCGNRKFFIDHWMLRRGGEQRCDCGGYHFPHRAGSMYCSANPMADLHIARDRYGVQGEELAALQLDIAWEAEGGKVLDTCPF